MRLSNVSLLVVGIFSIAMEVLVMSAYGKCRTIDTTSDMLMQAEAVAITDTQCEDLSLARSLAMRGEYRRAQKVVRAIMADAK